MMEKAKIYNYLIQNGSLPPGNLDNMKFKISQELDTNSNSKSHLIEKLSVKIETFLRNKNYG